MADKNTLDNLTNQEIKELISRNEITLEQLNASNLRKLMDYEIDMLCIGEGDVDLICKCSDILDEIEPTPITSEEFMNIIKKFQREHIVIIDENTKSNAVPKMRFILKRAVIIAAIISILMTSTFAIASALGFDVYKYIAEIVRDPAGTESNVDEFTFYHNGKAKKYASIEEMINSENLDIMYPTEFPEGIYLISANMTNKDNGNKLVVFVTNCDQVSIMVELSSDPFISNTPDTHEFNGITYYIEQAEQFSAYCYHNNNSYYITANTREHIITIIENMKE